MMPASVLLFEDNLQDAAELASFYETNSSSSIPSSMQVKQILLEHGIDWISDINEAKKNIQRTGHTLFVLDIYIQNSSDTGLQLISLIRQREPSASIWLWSSNQYLQKRLLEQLGANAFFNKTETSRLIKALEEQNTVNNEGHSVKIHIKDSVADVTIPYREIIAVQRELNQYLLYRLQPGETECSLLRISRRNNLITVLSAIKPSVEAIFLQVSKNTLVNLLLMEGFYKDKKGYYLQMRQNTGFFEVGRAYVNRALNYLNNPINLLKRRTPNADS